MSVGRVFINIWMQCICEKFYGINTYVEAVWISNDKELQSGKLLD